MNLVVAFQIRNSQVAHVALVYHTIRQKPRSNQVAEPLGGVRLDLVVERSHLPLAHLKHLPSSLTNSLLTIPNVNR